MKNEPQLIYVNDVEWLHSLCIYCTLYTNYMGSAVRQIFGKGNHNKMNPLALAVSTHTHTMEVSLYSLILVNVSNKNN